MKEQLNVFWLQGGAPDAGWLGDWMRPRVDMDAVAKGERHGSARDRTVIVHTAALSLS